MNNALHFKAFLILHAMIAAETLGPEALLLFVAVTEEEDFVEVVNYAQSLAEKREAYEECEALQKRLKHFKNIKSMLKEEDVPVEQEK